MDKATHHDHSHVQSLWLEKSDAKVLSQKESQKFVAVSILSFREWERVTRTGWIIWFEKNLLGVPKCSWYKSKWAAGPFLDYFEWVLQQQLEGVHSIPGRHVWLKIIQKRSRCPFWFLPGTLFFGTLISFIGDYCQRQVIHWADDDGVFNAGQLLTGTIEVFLILKIPSERS